MFEIGKRYMLRTTNKLSAKTKCEKIVIHSCEDRGDYYYVGYSRVRSASNMNFGYIRIYKDAKKTERYAILRELIDTCEEG